MSYIFNLCPKCKDKLVERIVDDISKCEEKYCPNCGNKMDIVLSGDKKEETVVYKITLNQVQDIKDKYLNVIMQMGNFDEKAALEKINGKDSISFEGDLLNTYLNLELLDETEGLVDYTVTPCFPYKRLFIQKCPDCGEKAIYRIEEIGEDEIQTGFFCEKCSEWVWYDICNKSKIDETLYHLKILLKEDEDEVKQEIMSTMNQLHDKEVLEDEIIVRDLARNIEYLLEIVKTYNIAYEINPPYPHKIYTLKKEWTEEDVKQLMAANPGLVLNLEEMNALS